MGETRKLAAILVADVVGYSRLAAADEDRTLARLRGLRSDLIDPADRRASRAYRQAHRRRAHHRVPQRGRRRALRDRSAERHDRAQCGLPAERRIELRVGIHLGDVVEESDGDLMGDGVNIAARLEGDRQARRDLSLRAGLLASQGAARSRRHRSRRPATQEHRRPDPGLFASKSASPARAKHLASPRLVEKSTPPHLSMVVLPFANIGGDPEQEHFVDGVTESLTTDLSRIRGSFVIGRNTAFTYKGKPVDLKTNRQRVERPLCP